MQTIINVSNFCSNNTESTLSLEETTENLINKSILYENDPDLIEEDKEDYFKQDIDNELLYSIKEYNNCKYLTLSESKLYNKLYNNYKLKLPYEYLVREIILYRVPESYYMIQLNGLNILTGIKIKNHDDNLCDYSFTIKNKDGITCNLNDHCYLNTTRIDNLTITHPNNLKFDSDFIYIEFNGFKYDNKKHIFVDKEEKTIYKHYISYYDISNFNHIIESMDIYCTLKNNNEDGMLLLLVNGKLIKKIIVRNTNFMIDNIYIKKIKCHPINDKFILPVSIMNNYIEDKLINNSLDVSRINDIRLVCVNLILNKLNSNFYNIYTLPYRQQIFCT